jgi:hypothetical protein
MKNVKDLNLTMTPSFALGRIDVDSGKLKVLKLIKGAQPIEVFEKAIDDVRNTGRAGL